MLEVDEKRKRIALTMRLADEAPKVSAAIKDEQRVHKRPNTQRPQEHRKPQEDRRSAPPINNAMADALRKLKG